MSRLNLSDLGSLDAAFYVIKFCYSSIVSLFGDNFQTVITLSIIFSALFAIVPLASNAIGKSLK